MLFRRKLLMSGGGVKPILPAAYQQIEYIQSTGNGTNSGGQYINPGIATGGWTVVMDIMLTREPSREGAMFSQYGGGNISSSLCNFNSAGNFLSSGYGVNTTSVPNPPLTKDNRFVVTGVCTYSSSRTTTRPPWLFSQNEGQSYGYHSISARMYSCKISIDNVLIRDLYPCYRKSDGAAGMYDIVNNVFYPNLSGGTDFTKGPDYIGVL